jgi:hypothetical protein
MPDSDDSRVLLSDILGALVSGAAQARQIADMATVNLAHLYRRHPLMQSMAVPRLRFRSIEVSLPVLVKGVRPSTALKMIPAIRVAEAVADEVQRLAGMAAEKMAFDRELLSGGDAAYKDLSIGIGLWRALADPEVRTLSAESIREQFQARVYSFLEARGLDTASTLEPIIREEMSQAARTGVKRLVRDILLRALHLISPESETPVGLLGSGAQECAERLAKSIGQSDAYIDAANKREYLRKLFKDISENRRYGKIIQAAGQAASDMCFSVEPAPAELELEVCTDDIKNKADAGTLTHLRFNLLEEGLSWIEDEQGSRLISE